MSKGEIYLRLKEELPEFSRGLMWLNGSVTKHEVIGKVPILIHFWSVSCNSCKSTMASINKWRYLYEGKLNVIGVHMPRIKEDLDAQLIRNTANQLQIVHPVCMDQELVLTRRYQNRFVPAYYVFDKNGLLRHYQSGETGMRMLESKLIHLMDEQK